MSRAPQLDMKIRVVGNSVGIKIRPPRAGADDLTYSEIVARAGYEVTNVSMAGVLLSGSSACSTTT